MKIWYLKPKQQNKQVYKWNILLTILFKPVINSLFWLLFQIENILVCIVGFPPDQIILFIVITELIN